MATVIHIHNAPHHKALVFSKWLQEIDIEFSLFQVDAQSPDLFGWDEKGFLAIQFAATYSIYFTLYGDKE